MSNYTDFLFGKTDQVIGDLREARRLLNQGWCRQHGARDSEQIPTLWTHDSVQYVCLMTAISRSVYNRTRGKIDEDFRYENLYRARSGYVDFVDNPRCKAACYAVGMLISHKHNESVVSGFMSVKNRLIEFNDKVCRSKEQVVQMVDDTIELLSQIDKLPDFLNESLET